jgi:hypothetical protein
MLLAKMAADQPEQRESLMCIWPQLLPPLEANQESESVQDRSSINNSQHKFNVPSFQGCQCKVFYGDLVIPGKPKLLGA